MQDCYCRLYNRIENKSRIQKKHINRIYKYDERKNKKKQEKTTIEINK